MAQHVLFPRIPESALLHHPSGSGIVDKEITPQGPETLPVETVVYHTPKRLRAETLVPVRFPDPVADLGIFFAYIDVALSAGVIPHAADGFSGLFEFQRPSSKS